MRALSGMFFSVASVQMPDPVLLVGAPLLLAGSSLPIRRLRENLETPHSQNSL
jgi:hypothetical protein